MKFPLVASSMAWHSTLLKTLPHNTSRLCYSSTLAKRTRSLGQLPVSETASHTADHHHLIGDLISRHQKQPMFYSTSPEKQTLNYSNEGNKEQQVSAKRDPSLKPTNEQLIKIKEKLTAHVRPVLDFRFPSKESAFTWNSVSASEISSGNPSVLSLYSRCHLWEFLRRARKNDGVSPLNLIFDHTFGLRWPPFV